MASVELHPWQEEAVEKMHNGCVLNGDVGTGKTITALAYALLKEPGRDIYVITTAKKRDAMDWHNEAMKLGVPVDKFHVDSWNNIGHYHKVYGALFIFDEQRLVGTGAWVKTFYDIARKNHWILLSATPGDTWLDYAPVFIANGFYKNITQFREEHVVYMPRVQFPKVKKYLNEAKLTRLKWQIMVEMPMERHTTRHIEMIECDYDQEVFKKVWTRRWNVFDDCPIRDAGELFRVGRKVVASHESRLNEVRRLLTMHRKLIVFYNFDYELEILRTLLPVSTSTETRSSCSETPTCLDSASQSEPGSTVGTPYTPRTTTDTSRSATRTSLDSDPLAGTIWEKGFDEDDASTWTTSSDSESLEKTGSTAQKTSRSSLRKTAPTQTPVSTECSQVQSLSSGSSSGSAPAATLPSLRSTSENSTGSATSIPTSGSASFAIAEWNGHKHEKIPNTDSWVYLVQYTSGSEGWNCTTTDAMVFYSLTYSYKQFYQSQGRIDRMNTPFKDLYYYVLTSRSVVDKAVWRALSQKKDFQVRSKRW